MKNFMSRKAGKIIVNIMIMSLLVMPLAAALPASAAPALPNWNVTGTYVLLSQGQYAHDIVIGPQNPDGTFSGTGGYPAGGSPYSAAGQTTETITGQVTGNAISLTITYNGPFNPGYTTTLNGTIAQDGSFSGTDPLEWHTTSGHAVSLFSLAAQDFGVMDQSGVKGYTAGFGLSGAQLTDIQSAVVKLYSGTTLLQTDTSTALLSGLSGTQFSSPFDVYGNFNYVTDGYWTNVRGAEYGQTLIPNKVVATVTLNNGAVLTATNTNLTGDTSTIYPTTVTVTIDKYMDGVAATAANSNSSAFPMTETYTIGGVTASTTYTLSPTGINSANAYEAVTSPLDANSNYTTNEITGGEVVGATCNSDQPFALLGYTSGSTLAQAQAATPTLTAPSFTGLIGNMYVIVWNHDCSKTTGPINGTVTGGNSSLGILAVTSITPVNTTATADNTYADGWSYIFNITEPTNETHLAMKFGDWLSGANTIAAGGNMEISSAQADNSGAEIPITAADTYSAPLHMTTDLDPSTPGLQVQVLVNVKIPLNSVNGSYSTNYGVQTNP